MAKRLCFISSESCFPAFVEKEIEFTYYSGFAVSQKQKCINDMHESINKYDDKLKVLEISTKSTNPLGVALSAFNLKFFDSCSNKYFNIENVFQSSKIFINGGPYKDLLYINPRDAKRDERLKTSGDLIQFSFNNITWPLVPKSLFYDWIYISALNANDDLSMGIMDYNAFTDIEFNHMKSYNCQARSAAIFVSLKKNNSVDKFLCNAEFRNSVYENNYCNIPKQLSLFD